MSESKELLEATIKGLEEKLESVKSDLSMKVRELDDVNKPVMTSEMFENITDLVEDAVDSVYLNEDELEYSMEFDYDNKVVLNDISLRNADVFSDKIMSEIDSHYKIVTKE